MTKVDERNCSLDEWASYWIPEINLTHQKKVDKRYNDMCRYALKILIYSLLDDASFIIHHPVQDVSSFSYFDSGQIIGGLIEFSLCKHLGVFFTPCELLNLSFILCPS